MAKKTISFVAREELAEWIEEEADHRMTTVSSAAQQLLAEKYRADQEEIGEVEDEEIAEQDEEADESPQWMDNLLEMYPDKWYRPDSDNYDYAVRTPDGGRKYRSTKKGAVHLVNRYYGD